MSGWDSAQAACPALRLPLLRETPGKGCPRCVSPPASTPLEGHSASPSLQNAAMTGFWRTRWAVLPANGNLKKRDPKSEFLGLKLRPQKMSLRESDQEKRGLEKQKEGCKAQTGPLWRGREQGGGRRLRGQRGAAFNEAAGAPQPVNIMRRHVIVKTLKSQQEKVDIAEGMRTGPPAMSTQRHLSRAGRQDLQAWSCAPSSACRGKAERRPHKWGPGDFSQRGSGWGNAGRRSGVGMCGDAGKNARQRRGAEAESG